MSEKMIRISIFIPQKMLDEIAKTYPKRGCVDRSEYIRLAIADSLNLKEVEA